MKKTGGDATKLCREQPRSLPRQRGTKTRSAGRAHSAVFELAILEGAIEHNPVKHTDVAVPLTARLSSPVTRRGRSGCFRSGGARTRSQDQPNGLRNR